MPCSPYFQSIYLFYEYNYIPNTYFLYAYETIIVQIFTKFNSKHLYYVKLYVHVRRGKMDYIQRMRNLREDSDKTQQQIADYLGTSQTMYARYERGANELPIHHLLALCKYYNVSADYILGLSNIKQISK